MISKIRKAPKNILVTGGCGFIGSNLVDKLINLGYEVIVVDDLSSGKKEFMNSDAKYIFKDFKLQNKSKYPIYFSFQQGI